MVRVLHLLVLGLMPSASGPALAVGADPEPELPAPKWCPKNGPLPSPGDHAWEWWGQVVAVDRVSLTVRDPAGGRLRHFMVRHALLEPRPPGFGARTGYRLPDVKRGDIVNLGYTRTDGVDTCMDIVIYRRPGGKMPPVPGEDPQAPFHHHERMQAYQDWEEKGTPIPPEHLPAGRGMLAVPYPPEAPSPRPKLGG